jgi:hypothetical protein
VSRDVERAGRQVLQRAELPHRVVARFHHFAGVGDQRSARLGQRRLVRVPREERRSDFVFELLDALADRRLRAAHSLCGPRESPLLGNGEEVFELEKVHLTTLPTTRPAYRARQTVARSSCRRDGGFPAFPRYS